MDKIGKTFALLLILIIAISCLSLMVVKLGSAQSLTTSISAINGYHYKNNDIVILFPTSGPSNTNVQVKCSGFYPKSPVNVILHNSSDNFAQDLQIIGQNTADDNGNLSFNVTIPNLSVGAYKFVVEDYTPRSTAEAQFTVTPTITTPTPTTSPTVPEYSWSVFASLLVCVFATAVVFRHRKIVDSKQ
jgi:hypothetical protein